MSDDGELAWTPGHRLAAGVRSGELSARDFRMIDCQMATPHLLSLGARLIPRPSFIEMLAGHVGDEPAPQRWADATPASADSDSAT